LFCIFFSSKSLSISLDLYALSAPNDPISIPKLSMNVSTIEISEVFAKVVVAFRIAPESASVAIWFLYPVAYCFLPA